MSEPMLTHSINVTLENQEKVTLSTSNDDHQATSSSFEKLNAHFIAIDKIDKNIGNVKEIEAFQSDFPSIAYVMLRNFLDSELPVFDGKLLDLLMTEGTLELLLSFVTRMEKAPIVGDRDFTDNVILRRSYQVMDLLTSNDSFNKRLMLEKYQSIIYLLFDSFDACSNANFHHVVRIFDAMKRMFPKKGLDSFVLTWQSFESISRTKVIKQLAPNQIEISDLPVRQGPTLLLLLAIPHLSHSLVQSFLLHIIIMQPFNQTDLELYRDFFDGIIDVLVNEKYSSCTYFPVAEFVETLFFEVSKREQCEIFYSVFEHYPALLERLLGALKDITVKTGDWTRKNAILSVLYSLFRKRASQITNLVKNQSSLVSSLTEAKPEPLILSKNASSIENVCAVVRKRLGSHIETLSFLILYKPQECQNDNRIIFDFPRLWAVEIFYEAIREENFLIPDLLSRIDPRVWKVLVDWFFDYAGNNAYHGIFYKILKTVLELNDVNTLKLLLTRQKLISRVISVLEDPSHANEGNRGYCLLILNTLRLYADVVSSSDYLYVVVNSHNKYKEFLPVLINMTLAQTNGFKVASSGTARKIVIPYLSPLQMSVPPDSDQIGDYVGGIELGSTYANCLGVYARSRGHASSLDSTTKSPASERSSSRPFSPFPESPLTPIPNSFRVGSSIGGSGAGSGGGKKKKRRSGSGSGSGFSSPLMSNSSFNP